MVIGLKINLVHMASKRNKKRPAPYTHRTYNFNDFPILSHDIPYPIRTLLHIRMCQNMGQTTKKRLENQPFSSPFCVRYCLIKNLYYSINASSHFLVVITLNMTIYIYRSLNGTMSHKSFCHLIWYIC